MFGVQDGEHCDGPQPLGAFCEECTLPAWRCGNAFGNALEMSKSGRLIGWMPWTMESSGPSDNMNTAARGAGGLVEINELAASEQCLRAVGLRLTRCVV